jgi:hypothetical protein
VHSNVLPVSMVLFSEIKEQTSLQDYAQEKLSVGKN